MPIRRWQVQGEYSGRPPVPDALAEDLGRAQAGDSLALQRMLASIAPEVVRVARAILGSDPSELDDAVQEALIGFVKAVGGFRHDCSVRRFAQRIATRTALATRRRARRRSAAQQTFDDRIHDMDARSDPQRQSLALRRQRLLRELLDALPEPQAETLALRVVLGMSLREVATVTRAPENTVRSRLRLAREALRQRIEADPKLLELMEKGP